MAFSFGAYRFDGRWFGHLIKYIPLKRGVLNQKEVGSQDADLRQERVVVDGDASEWRELVGWLRCVTRDDQMTTWHNDLPIVCLVLAFYVSSPFALPLIWWLVAPRRLNLKPN